MVMQLQEIITHLEEARPNFHGRKGNHNWRISRKFLNYLVTVLRPGNRTLEIGCGYSTVVFAGAGTQHIVISPLAEEHESIRKYLDLHQILSSNIQFIKGSSDSVLPNLSLEPLDLVLIDGNHDFPFPILDYHYLFPYLKKGGLLVIDDIHLFPVQILREYLLSEVSLWKNVITIQNTSIFKKKVPDFLPDEKVTQGQQFCYASNRILTHMLITRQKLILGRFPAVRQLLRWRGSFRAILEKKRSTKGS